MTTIRSWHWIGNLVDPRERDKIAIRAFTSLAFMPDTLVLEKPDLCFFRSSNILTSGCLLVGGSRGADTLDQTARAI